jgi:hypothetical protein
MTDPELARELIESAGVNVHAVVWQERISPLCDEIARAALAEDYAETSAQFPGEEIRIDDVDAPYVHVQDGDWELRYFPPAAIEIHHAGQMVRTWSLYTDDGIPIDQLSAVTMGDLRARLTRYLVDG